ncbi:MAG: multidrug effflux MFS transporter [Spartobacteria bacterium]
MEGREASDGHGRQRFWSTAISRATRSIVGDNGRIIVGLTSRGAAGDKKRRMKLPNVAATQPSTGFFYGLTVALFFYGWLSVNIYLPILPKLEEIFDTTSQMARLTVTAYLLGFSVAQLVLGTLSDRFGRRPIIILGLALATIGAVLTALTSDIYSFTAARFLESVGLGVAPVLSRSILTDSLDRPHIAIAISYAVMASALTPAVAPIVGGYLDLFLSWRSIFFFLALYGCVLTTWIFFRLPETNKDRTPELRPSRVLSEYLAMLRTRQYSGYLISYGIAFGGLIGYYAAAPYLFIKVLGYRPHEYGYLLLINAAFYIFGVWTGKTIVVRSGSKRPIAFAILAYLIASLVFVVMDSFTDMSAVTILIPMCVFIFGSGLVSPAANSGAMSIFKTKAGASTAIIGFSIAIGGAFFNTGLSTVHISRLWELGTYVAIIALASAANYFINLQEKPRASVA